MIRLKRIYDTAEDGDGRRILVDRLWPRGVSKAGAALDEWNKDVAPSPELRQWFGHRPERFPEFRERYLEELAHNDAAKELAAQSKKEDITLLYSARDRETNQAVVLKQFLDQ